MAPNSHKSISETTDLSLENKSKSPTIQEVLIDGYYYDVTNFVNRHPGGNVIKFYTEKGEDASSAVQQFHYRSSEKVHKMMKSFKRRPAEPSDSVLDPAQQLKHQTLTEDFVKLYVEIEKEGLFKPSYIHVTLRLLEVWILFGISLEIFASGKYETLGWRIFGSILFGFMGGRAGWFMHEGGHRSLTGKPKLDQFLQSLTIGAMVGLSGQWWNRGHNKHHAMPQRLNRDVDLNTMPFLAYNVKVVKDSKQGQNFMIRNQAWLYLSLDCFVGILAWKVYICPRNSWKRGDYMDLCFMLINWYIVYNYIKCWEFCLGIWLGGNYMFGNFSLSHTHLPVTDESTHWVQYGLTHTANVKSSWLVDWWMGYLNFQIEHHLFPTLPQFRCHLISKRVKAIAEKHGLPYHVHSYTDAWKMTMQNFKDVARQLSNPTEEHENKVKLN